MIKGLAHTGVCVPDVEAAVAWYRDVLGLAVLSPPYLMEGDALRRDMGELVPDPRMKAAIVGFPNDGDRVLEVIEYPDVAGESGTSRALTDHGLSHVGLLCDDIDATRATLEGRGEKTCPQRPYCAQWAARSRAPESLPRYPAGVPKGWP